MKVPDRYRVERTFFKRRKDGRTGIFVIHMPSEDQVWTQGGSFSAQGEGGLMVNMHKYKPKNIGRKDEKSRSQVAVEDYLRRIKSKIREGYREARDLESALGEVKSLPAVADEALPDLLNLEESCPGFRPWKPQNSLVHGSPLWRTVVQGQALCIRKHDGYGVMLVKDRGQFDVYSLRAQRASPVGGTLRDRLVMVQDWVEVYGDLIPDGTVILAEVVPLGEEDRPYEYVTSVLKSKVEEAISKQETRHFLGLYWWDIIVWAHNPIGKVSSAEDRIGLICDVLQSAESGKPNLGLSHALEHGAGMHPKDIMRINLPPSPLVMLEPQTYAIDSSCADPVEKLISQAVLEDWEGFVVVDPVAVYGDSAWSILGRAPRPAGAAKLKPILEDDFVVMWDPDNGAGAFGSGKNADRIGAVALYQWDGDELRYCGDCGVGFTDEQRDTFMHSLREYPQVMSIAFRGWTQRGMLRHATFLRLREDKDMELCFYSGPRP